ncbi:hypothetical protein Tco_0902911 [Tanacetum coccineum]
MFEGSTFGEEDSAELVDGEEKGFTKMQLDSEDSKLQEQQEQVLDLLTVDHQCYHHTLLQTIDPIQVQLVSELLLLTEHTRTVILFRKVIITSCASSLDLRK